jgi:hypothetical protein
MSLPRVPKMQQRARKTQALEALTHLRPLLRARRNHKKYLQNGFFSGLLVDHVCYTPIVRANEDDGAITFLCVKRVGTSLRHLGRHFGRQRVKVNARWHGVADRLGGILPRLRQFQVLYILFDNESLLLGQIDGARLGSDRRLIRVLRPQDMFRRREGYAERERGGDQPSATLRYCSTRTPSFNPMS